MIANIFIRLLFICTSVILILIVSYGLIVDVPDNGCTMTWMYQYPEYIRVSLPTSVEKRFPKYGLYLYGEGYYAEYLSSMNGKYNLNGIPALFVHGNGGKFKQVRSPASVSLRKSESRKYHFNYFSVDYKEELSALYGPFLYRQTKYLYHAIERIFECYAHLKVEERPQTVIAIGHSMGGLVLRGIHSFPEVAAGVNFKHNMVNTIVTLASPHVRPPLMLDRYLYTYYQTLDEFWTKESTLSLRNVNVLSLGGGIRDFQVHSQLCVLQSNNSFHANVMTSAISSIWLSTDHQCIVWCNELVRAITRAFFQLINEKTGQCTLNTMTRHHVLSRIFFENNNQVMKESLPSACQDINVSDKLLQKKIISDGCYFINIPNYGQHKMIYIWAKTSSTNWVYSCYTNTCSTVDYLNLPSKSPQKSKFVALHLKGPILLKLNANDRLFIQIYQPQFTEVHAPLCFPRNFSKSFAKTIFIAISIESFTEAWEVYEVAFDNTSRGVDYFIQIDVPWSNEKEIFVLNSSKNYFKTYLFSEKPTANPDKKIQMQIWSESFESISFTIKPNIIDSFSRIVQIHAELILRYIIVFAILRSYFHTGSCNRHPSSLLITTHRVGLFVVVGFISNFRESFGYDEIANFHFTIKRFLIPQLSCLIFAIILSDGFHIVCSVILDVIIFLIYPISWLFTKLIHRVSALYLCACTILVAAMWMLLELPASLTLLVLTVIDIVQMSSKSKQKLMEHKSILLGLLPTIIVFSVVPTIVYIKDMTEGFPHEVSFFHNVTALVISYYTYQCLRIYCTINLDYITMKHVLNCLFLILSTYGCSPDMILFYNLPYLTVAFMLFLSLHYKRNERSMSP